MRFQDENTRVRSLAVAAIAMVATLLFAFILTIPIYSQGSSEKAWEILKAGAASKSTDSRVRAML